MPQRLQAAREKTVGAKQTIKALKKDQVRVVYVAENAERNIIEPILAACREKQIPVVRVDSMKTLGKACGIKVGCASAAIIGESSTDST
ncbi:MAG: ribosomal L7Ae/L30e/S12e/Gadd45 family protein [Firmicutes bacterium]|nr:ribosomal L7Ae/L30e/S12e/Gadd45 family protein [Bacillota bacterium]